MVFRLSQKFITRFIVGIWPCSLLFWKPDNIPFPHAYMPRADGRYFQCTFVPKVYAVSMSNRFPDARQRLSVHLFTRFSLFSSSDRNFLFYAIYQFWYAFSDDILRLRSGKLLYGNSYGRLSPRKFLAEVGVALQTIPWWIQALARKRKWSPAVEAKPPESWV